MEDFPKALRELCEEKPNDDFYCIKLKKLFYCTRALSTRSLASRNGFKRDAIVSYCHDSLGGVEVKHGLPDFWDVSYYVKHLTEEAHKSPEKSVVVLDQTLEALKRISGRNNFPDRHN